MSAPVLHQVTVGATPGDAITDQAIVLRRWLRELGYVSEIYADHIHPALAGDILSMSAYRARPDEKHIIFHHSTGSPLVERLVAMPQKLVLIYHNVTPPEFFERVDPILAREMAEGRRQVASLLPRTALALADSAYNADELTAAGFQDAGVLPITLDERQYEAPENPALLDAWRGRSPRLLFVGRLVPNKRQDDLIKLLYYVRRAAPQAHLLLVGNPWVPEYTRWLTDLAADLRLSDAVTIVGHVSQADLVNYYRLADLYVSMSEHEGFGKPLIESMYLGLPVLAYAAASVPGTLGGAGVLFHAKHFEALAELVDLLAIDQAWRARIQAGQTARVQAFREAAVRQQWVTNLNRLGAA